MRTFQVMAVLAALGWVGIVAGVATSGSPEPSGEVVLDPGVASTLELSSDWNGGVGCVFQAESPGLLSVVVRADGDVSVEAFDASGFALTGGWSDQDLDGDFGAEQFAASVEEAGPVRIVVTSFGDATSATVTAGFTAMTEMANDDADRRPKGALALTVGVPVQDQLDPSDGDTVDTFRLEGRGLTVVEVRASSGDVELSGVQVPRNTGDGEGFIGSLVSAMVGGNSGGMDDFANGGGYGAEFSPYYSDADLGGDFGHEAFVIMLQPGVPEYVQVISLDSEATSYTLRAWPAMEGWDAARRGVSAEGGMSESVDESDAGAAESDASSESPRAERKRPPY